MQVDLVTRGGCHLCEEALSVLRELGVEPRLLDVDGDPELGRLYDFRVPVVLADGRAVGEGRIERSAVARALGLLSIRVEPCGDEAAEITHRLTRAAFRGYDRLDPPSGAGRENLEDVRIDLAGRSGALALVDGRPVGCMRLAESGANLNVRRVAVEPSLQGRGVGTALMAWAEAEARRRGLAAVTVGVRVALPGNIDFYRRLGFEISESHSHPGFGRPTWVSMRKSLS